MEQALTVTLLARAKINLYLDILSRRENGYHNIQSIMQTVDLCDTVTLTRRAPGEGIHIETDAEGLPNDRRNLAWRAAEQFSVLLGAVPDVSIRIEKRIPMAAGLGGGSADAAAVLRGLNRLYRTDVPTSELCELGSRLGADIPFCIVGGAMVAEGIGEILTPCHGLSERFFVTVACGGEGVSTPEAYGALDSMYGNFAKPRAVGAHFAPLHAALATDDLQKIGTHMFNIFEQAVLPTHSVAPRLLTAMRESGSVAAMMSGSGPSVFGLFAEEAMARTAAERIGNDLGIRAFVTRPVNCYDD
jgi:4-diphosphocytidyl-2-C-methyl-D-erythritol kinase